MVWIVCADNRDGILFNGRRLSRDRAVCTDILRLAAGRALWMNAYSAKLFPTAENLHISEAPAQCAGADGLCFFENTTPEGDADTLVVYRWNRDYPADRYLSLTGWRRTDAEDFQGYSHERITREVYKR